MARLVIDTRSSRGGGIARFAQGVTEPLVATLQDRGHTVLVLAERRRWDDPVLPFDEIVYASEGDLLFSEECQSLVRRWRPDVVYSVNYLAERFESVPFVLTVHDVTRLKYPHLCVDSRGFSKRWSENAVASVISDGSSQGRAPKSLDFAAAFATAARRAWGSASRLVTVSQVSRTEIQRVLGVGAAPIDVVGVGCDHIPKDAVKPAFWPRLAAETRDGFLLLVGQVQPHKRVEWAVESLYSSGENGPLKIPTLIAGGFAENDREFLDRVGRYVAQRQLISVGRVHDRELLWLYRNAAALLVPSISEGFCLPAAEAAMAGCAVIASDLPVLHETLGGAAKYFPAGNREAFAVLATEAAAGKTRRPVEIAPTMSWRSVGERVANSLENVIALRP